MYIIAGLGNPGRQYEHTRHNMGFDVADALIEEYKIPQKGVKFQSVYGSGHIGREKAVIVKPLTFMNLSGQAVQPMTDFFKIEIETQLIVIYDDIDLELGQLRLRKQGSAGGHNGMKDIIQRLGTQKFIRVKVGVGAKPPGWDLADYVLSHFSASEQKIVEETQSRAVQAVACILNEGIDTAMNKYNG
ncbi:MAG: aminoacyl-tRNA hydrolase [Lachnospiraceae bacterium]